MTNGTIFKINGLQAAFYQIREGKSASICIKIRPGSWSEEGGSWGRVHLLEHVIFQGTERFPSKTELEDFSEDNGIISGGITFGSHIELTFKFPVDNIENVLLYISEVLFHPIINAHAIELEKKIIEREFQDKWSKVEKTFNYKINQQIFGLNHPYSRDGMGQIEFVNKTSLDNLKNIHEKMFVPSNITMAIVGDINENLFKEKLRNLLPNSKISEKQEEKISKPESGDAMVIVEDIGRKSALLKLSWLIAGSDILNLKERISLQIFSYLLGGGMRSTLFKEIRERLGLVYSIGSTTGFYPKSGWFQVFTSVAPEDSDIVIRKVKEQVQNLISNQIEEGNFQRTKKFLKYQKIFDFDSTFAAAQNLCGHLFWDNAYISPKEYADILDTIKEDEMRIVVKKLLQNSEPLVAILK